MKKQDKLVEAAMMPINPKAKQIKTKTLSEDERINQLIINSTPSQEINTGSLEAQIQFLEGKLSIDNKVVLKSMYESITKNLYTLRDLTNDMATEYYHSKK